MIIAATSLKLVGKSCHDGVIPQNDSDDDQDDEAKDTRTNKKEIPTFQK